MSVFNERSCMGNLSVDTRCSNEKFIGGNNNLNASSKEHYVLIHVEAGETFSVGMGDRVQHIPGPATIRMISNRGPPTPIPMEVPPGHLVQQIVDDDGVLTHVIISAYRSANEKNDKINKSSEKLESDQENSDGFDPIPNPDNIENELDQSCIGKGDDDLQKDESHHFSTPDKLLGKKKPFDNRRQYQLSSTETNKNRKKFFKRNSNHLDQKVETGEFIRKRREWPKAKGANYFKASSTDANSLTNITQTPSTKPDQNLLINLLSEIQLPLVSDVKATSAIITMSIPESLNNDSPTDNRDHENTTNDFTLEKDKIIYNLYLSECSNAEKKYLTCIYKGSNNTKCLQDLKPFTSYSVKASCSYDIGETSPSSNITFGQSSGIVTFVTETSVPSSPKKLMLMQKARNSLVIKWSPAYENGCKITDYLVQYSQESRSDCTKVDWHTGYRGQQKSCKLIQLNIQTKYLIRVCAINKHGKGPWSEILRTTTSGSPPQVPTKPKLVQADVHSLSVAWNPVRSHHHHHHNTTHQNSQFLDSFDMTEDIQYILDISDDCMKGDFVTVYQGSAPEHCIENLRRNSDYSFRVAAFNNDGQSNWSDVASFRTKSDVPLPPIDLKITENKTCPEMIELSWNEANDTGGSPITRFRLEVNLPIIANHLQNTNNSPLNSLQYRTDSVHIHFNGGITNPNKRQQLMKQSCLFNNPEIPLILNSWPRVIPNTVATLVGEDRSKCETFHTTSSKNLPLDIQNQSKDLSKNYIYPILCRDPMSLSILGKDFDWQWRNLNLIYPKNYDSDLDIVAQDYNLSSQSSNISEGNNRAWFIIYEGPYKSVKIDNLPCCKEIYFRVRSSNTICQESSKKKIDTDWCWSMASGQSLSLFPPAQPPGPDMEPPELVSIGPKSLVLSWKPPIHDGGNQIINYQLIMQEGVETLNEAQCHFIDQSLPDEDEELVKMLPSNFSLAYSGPSTEFTVNQLKSSVQYTFYIRAANSYGWTLLSEGLVQTTSVIPPDPPQFPPRCQLNTSNNNILLTWNEVTQHNGSKIIEYHLECLWKREECEISANPNDDLEQEYKLIYSGPELSFNLHDVSPATLYQFRYCAINTQGPSGYSPVSFCRTLGSCPDPPISLLVASTTTKTNARLNYNQDHSVIGECQTSAINVSWNEPVNNGEEITSYQLELKQIDLLVETTNTDIIDIPVSIDLFKINHLPIDASNEFAEKKVIRYIIDTLKPSTKYQLRVRAKNSFGFGPYSGVFKFITPPALPSSPIIEVTKVSSDSIRLKWSNTSKLTSNSSLNSFQTARLYEDGYINLGTKLPLSSSAPIHSNKNFYILQMLLNNKTHSSWQTVYQGYHTFHKISRLRESTEYSFRVLTIHQSVTGPYSQPVVVKTEKQAPPPCKNPKILDLTPTSVTLEWPLLAINLSNSTSDADVLDYENTQKIGLMTTTKDRLLYSVQMVSVKSSQTTANSVKSTPWHPSQVTGYREVYLDAMNRCRIMNLTPSSEYITRVCAVRRLSQTAGVNQVDDYSSSDDEERLQQCRRSKHLLKGPYSQGLFFTCPAIPSENESSPKHKTINNPGVLLSPSVTEALFLQKSTSKDEILTRTPSTNMTSMIGNKSNNKIKNLFFGKFSLPRFMTRGQSLQKVTSYQGLTNNTNTNINSQPSSSRRESLSDTYKACFFVFLFILVAFALTRALDLLMFPTGVNAMEILTIYDDPNEAGF